MLTPLAVGLAAVPFLVYVVNDFRPDPDLRTTGGEWSTSIEELQQQCRTSPGAGPLHVTIAPGKPWDVALTCAELVP
jgi:hypothetical protein